MKRQLMQVFGMSWLAMLAITIGRADAAVVASWDFEEAGGDTVSDGVGSYDATIGAGTGSRVATGDFGGALGQSWSGGTANILTAVYTNQFDSLTSMSTESWVKWDGTGVFHAWLSIPPTFEQFIHTGVPGVRFIMGGVDTAYLPLGLATPGEWQQWVMTYDAATTTMKVYANAVEVFSGSTGTGLNWAGAVMDQIGLNSEGTFNDGTVLGGVFPGLVDRLSIHDVALSPEQVLGRYFEIVPEPSAITLIVVGVLGIMMISRRRRG